jgi:uncharacterized LabA/DUF88 family protein
MMRIGVYIDGFNVYYGGSSLFEKEEKGWKWLDYRKLVETVVSQTSWKDEPIEVSRIVYCTADIKDGNSRIRQSIYQRALLESGSVTTIEKGNFVYRVRVSPLAVRGPHRRPILTKPDWPLKLQRADGGDEPDLKFMVSHLHTEEKGSDVNLASHLLTDVLEKRVDAAIVLSNDSDLKLPISNVRGKVPVGLINPRNTRLAGDLEGTPTQGAGNHWWYKLSRSDFTENQLPTAVGKQKKPPDW